MHGAMRISAPPTYARTRIAPLLPGFLARASRTSPRDGAHRPHVDVVGEPLDLGVRLGPLPDSSLARRRLSREQSCSAPRPAISPDGAPATVADLARRNCLVTATFGPRRRGSSAARAGRWSTSRRAWSATTWRCCTRRRAAGSASPCCRLARRRRPARGRARTGPGARASTRFNAHAVLPSGRHVPRRVRAFVDYLAAHLRGSCVVTARLARRGR